MTKISELPDYDISNIGPDDLIPAVQDGVTKKIGSGVISRVAATYDGDLSPTPTAAQLEAIIGVPQFDSSFIVKDTTGGGGLYFITYTGGFWFYCPLSEAA